MFRKLQVLIIGALCFCAAPASSAQTIFLSGDVGGAVVGPPLVPLDQGAVALTSRLGLGAEFDRFQVEIDVGVVAPAELDLSEGLLVVPSLDASFLFGRPTSRVRAYVGGGIDVVYVISDYTGFALPWAHLTAGVDSKISDRSSVYLEARTYGLESQLSVGSKFRF